MMIAMAGLGTPFGAIYILKRYLFPDKPLFVVILIVGGVVAVLCLLGFIISRIFGRGKRKRNKKMAADLAGDAEGGRVAMDVRAAVKANNDKFFGAIKEMRKGLGINIYDLPWYIVIGDSGCGKTRLINEGGLTFSTGKPEGYQLGTLNYNWWFTEDAIFVDMAGRLCNPQDDSDRREWQAFLNTIAKGRKGYPVNGALVCVSADHLLQDPPEKIEQDANTALERLRDLQSKLGVTFATYLIVTKCDKILGFMQFFDRAERDITFKNQIFGWSRPGEFTELYDPESYGQDFDQVYERLNELRLRRLQDEADEVDLGLAYSFPEEYRELRAPLQTYMRTLFPMIKNPRAIKNLILRGVYFTSATQEGELILKHVTERLGADAAGQFAPLDLYPNKRPHFIKDLLFRKVFPEFGLVFRNEEQAVRNRKLAKLFKFGSIALTVLFFAMGTVATLKFNKVIGKPRADAMETRTDEQLTPAQALVRTQALGADVGSLQQNSLWAGILSMGFGADQPIRDLQTIQAGLFERSLLRQSLIDIGAALRDTALADPRDGEEALRNAQTYLDAAEQYVAWYGCSLPDTPPKALNYDSFKKLCKVVSDPESPITTGGQDFLDQAANFFDVLASEGEHRNPARLLEDEELQAQATLKKSLLTVHRHWAAYARLDDTHPDADLQEWMRVYAACSTVEDSYSRMLDTATTQRDTLEEWEDFRKEFDGDYLAFAGAIPTLGWRPGDLDRAPRIPTLPEVILRQRDAWVAYQSQLQKAYAQCEGGADEWVTRAIQGLTIGDPAAGLAGVDQVLWNNLKEGGLTLHSYKPENLEPERFAEVVEEVYDRFPYVITYTAGEGINPDILQASFEVGTVNGVLAEIHGNLLQANFDAADDAGTPLDWINELDGYLDPGEEEEADAPALAGLDKLADFWQPDDLADLYYGHRDEIARGQCTRLLRTMSGRLDDVGRWGFAELVASADFADKRSSVYGIPIPEAEVDSGMRRVKDDEPARDTGRKRRSGRKKFGSQRSRRKSRPAREPVVTGVAAGMQFVPACATQEFLLERARECQWLLLDLSDLDSDYYLVSNDGGAPLHEVCADKLRDAGERYMSTYVQEWAQAYEDKDLRELSDLTEQADTWDSLATLMSKRKRSGSGVSRVSDELRAAVSEVLQALPFWSYAYDDNANEWYSEIDETDRHWREVAKWMADALEENWSVDYGEFVTRTLNPADVLDSPDRNEAPWTQLAGAFASRWHDLADGIAANSNLEKVFKRRSKRKRNEEGIPWGLIEKLRTDSRTDDEARLTGELAAFEGWAQQLLSAELTNFLCDLQSSHFKDYDQPYDGWPYLQGEETGAKALQVVDFEAFRNFISEVDQAQQVFDPLEAGFADNEPLSAARRTFYTSCKDWVEFLRLDDKRTPEALTISVFYADPLYEGSGKVEVQDTAQNYYATVELDLGLEIEQEGKFVEAPVLIKTSFEERTNPPQAKWTWGQRGGERELLVRLVDGFQLEGMKEKCPELSDMLGTYSEMALCAYLHRYGKGNEREWVTTHAFDLHQEFRAAGRGKLLERVPSDRRLTGLSLKFTLERPMPGPVVKLEEADTPTR